MLKVLLMTYTFSKTKNLVSLYFFLSFVTEMYCSTHNLQLFVLSLTVCSLQAFPA
jgi:hypothetical protein